MRTREVWVMWLVEGEARFERFEAEGGSCPACGQGAELWTCCECGTSAWVIDCRHRKTRFGLRRGRSNGTACGRVFCVECADALPMTA